MAMLWDSVVSNAFCSACRRPWRRYVQHAEPVPQVVTSSCVAPSSCLCWGAAADPVKMALVEQGDKAPPENCHRLVVLGSSKVGKTSIVGRFLYNKFEDNYTPTIEDFHRKVYRIKGAAYRLDILDTSGNHPFPAMRRLSLLTGDLFILVYAIDNRESYDEVLRLREQIMECKRQCTGVKTFKLLNVPTVVVGNKLDREKDRVLDRDEVTSLFEACPSTAYVETSAKKNINIDEVFLKLFDIAKLPAEMSPALHRKVQPTYVGRGGAGAPGRMMSIRRKMSDACGAVAPNVRRPSIRTDLLVAQSRTQRPKEEAVDTRDSRCVLQ